MQLQRTGLGDFMYLASINGVFSRPRVNCIAVGKGAGDFFKKGLPPKPLVWRDREAEGGDAAGPAQNPTGGKEAEAQGAGTDPFLPAQVPLKQDAQVIAQHRQRQGRLGAPELFQAQLRQAEMGAEFLDDVFAIGPAVVVPPNRQRFDCGGQAGDQGLIGPTRTVQQTLAGGRNRVGEPAPDQNQPAGGGPMVLLMQHVGHFQIRVIGRLPNGLPFEQVLQGLIQPRHHDIVQVLAFQQRQPVRFTKPGIGPHQPQAQVRGQPTQQFQGESHDVVVRADVAGPQPEAGHQAGFGDKPQQRMQTAFKTVRRVAPLDAFLLARFMQQLRRIQVQGVTAGPAAQPVQTPVPQRTKTPQIAPGPGEALKETGVTGLAAQALDGQQRSQQHSPPQVRHLRQLGGPGQNPRQETQRQIFRRQRVGAPPPVGQPQCQLLSEPMPVQKTGKGRQPRMPADTLVGEANLDRFLPRSQFNKPGHCLGNRFVGVLVRVLHTTSRTSQQWPFWQLHSYGLIGMPEFNPVMVVPDFCECAEMTHGRDTIVAVERAMELVLRAVGKPNFPRGQP